MYLLFTALFLDDKILTLTKLEAFADHKINDAKIIIPVFEKVKNVSVFDWVENTVGKEKKKKK